MGKEPVVRWGILSTARIATTAFLPGLRAAGGGRAEVVAGRDLARAQQFAAEHGVERAVEGYQRLLDDDRVAAVYICLPNSLHAEWTMAALQAGKAVLCEKPLCTSEQETAHVLQVARNTGSLLWEAFVFPFHDQMRRVRELIDEGEIGELEEIQSNWHFQVRSRQNIRLSPQLAGGALNDVGCYCLHLGSQLFRDEPIAAAGAARLAPEGVDEETRAVVSYPGERSLVMGVGVRRGYIDTFTRILGSRGEIRLSHAYHPRPQDTIEVRTAERTVIERVTGPDPSFTPAIRHLHAAIRGEEPPRHLAVDDAMPTAAALERVRRGLGLVRHG